MQNLKKMTEIELVALSNNCELDKNGEFWYEGPDGELMDKIENEIDRRCRERAEKPKKEKKLKTYKCKKCGVESILPETRKTKKCLNCRKNLIGE